MKKFILIYSTLPDRDSARRMGEILVQHKAVACVNLMDGMESIYQWDGKLVNDKEVVLLAKTQEDKFDQAKEIILKNHSYDNPCILALPIENGSQNFLNWVEDKIK